MEGVHRHTSSRGVRALLYRWLLSEDPILSEEAESLSAYYPSP